MNWIKVSDRLPQLGEEVNVYIPSHHAVRSLSRGIRWEGDSEYFWRNAYGGDNYHAMEMITHWRPLPEPPKEANNG